VSNPAAPVAVGSYDTGGDAGGVQVAGNLVYVADGEAGVQVIDVSNPAAPVRVGGYDTNGWASAVAVMGDHVCVADSDWGLAIVRFTPPLALLRLTWPASNLTFVPETAPSPAGPWAPVTETSVTTGSNYQLTVAPLGSQGFFRLGKGYGTPVALTIFNTAARDRGPSLSSDGRTLYFCSDRAGQFDLFVATRPSPTGQWSAATVVQGINTPGDEFFPALSADGLSLYFCDQFSLPSTRPGNLGQADIWVARRTSPSGPWQPPINLGFPVNSEYFEYSPAISSDERTLLFASLDRPGHGSFDLWMSTRSDPADPLGWGTPVNLGPVINSRYSDCCAHLSRDGRVLYFSSDRPIPGRPANLNHIWVSRRNSDSEPFGPPVSLVASFMDMHFMGDPCLSPDGTTLFFNSTGRLSNPATYGDLWQAPVVAPPQLSISLLETP
jgi:hypothetical protein